MRNTSRAEQSAAYHRLAYRIELLIQRRRRTVSRRIVDGGCVVLEPERFKPGKSAGGRNRQ
jgi:hypothetical protein